MVAKGQPCPKVIHILMVMLVVMVLMAVVVEVMLLLVVKPTCVQPKK